MLSVQVWLKSLSQNNLFHTSHTALGWIQDGDCLPWSSPPRHPGTIRWPVTFKLSIHWSHNSSPRGDESSGFASGVTGDSKVPVVTNCPVLTPAPLGQAPFVTQIRNKLREFPKLFPVSNQMLQLEVPLSPKHQTHHHNRHLNSWEQLIIVGNS